MCGKIFKIWKIGAKFVRTILTIQKRDERKLLPQHFTPRTVDVHPYKNISLARYRVPQKLLSSYRWYQKRTVGPTFVRTESLLSRAILENVLGAYYRGWYVVVHPCSIFSIRRQMAPVQSIKFQTVNFPIFCARIIVIFCTTFIAREVFSLVTMSNGKQILPVSQWLEVVVAFVSSLICSSSVFCILALMICIDL